MLEYDRVPGDREKCSYSKCLLFFRLISSKRYSINKIAWMHKLVKSYNIRSENNDSHLSNQTIDSYNYTWIFSNR